MRYDSGDAMKYEEFAPAHSWAIERIWTLEGHADALGGSPQPILPDGRPELVVHIGEPFFRVSGAGVRVRQPGVLWAGQLRRQLLLQPSGRIGIVGVRFHPHAGPSLFRMPQHEVTDRTPEVRDLNPALAADLARVRDSITTVAAAAAEVERIVARHLEPDRLDARIEWAVRAIAGRRGLVTIDAVADGAGLTRRHLERRFREDVGISPKRLARIVRFQRALQHLEQSDAANRGALTAAACGYADQAHFVRDFQDLAGTAPGTHLIEQAVLTGFFRMPIEEHPR